MLILNNNPSEYQYRIKPLGILTLANIIVGLPFIICDFYWANNDISCQYIQAWKINLYLWLSVYGLLNTFQIVFSSVGFYIYGESFYWLSKEIFKCFTTGWLIIGAICYWKWIVPTGYCLDPFAVYMWVRLIAGIGNSFLWICKIIGGFNHTDASWNNITGFLLIINLF
jgi:hypothetical protein